MLNTMEDEQKFSQPHNLLEWFDIGMDVLMNGEVLMLVECLATPFIFTLYRKKQSNNNDNNENHNNPSG